MVERVVEYLTPPKIETFKKTFFWEYGSLLKVGANWWSIESLVTKWDVKNQVSDLAHLTRVQLSRNIPEF